MSYQSAYQNICHRQFVGSAVTGHAGLGTMSTTQCNKLEGKERQDLVQREVSAGVEEQHAIQRVGLRQQGGWTRWEEAMDRKITWPELWRAEP